MYYSILHKTRYRYSAPVTENVTEVRMQPRSEGLQRCLSFKLTTTPSARVNSYTDSFGNIIHHFDIPAPHRSITLTAEALVILPPFDPLPYALDPAAWYQLDALKANEDVWDFLVPSHFARPTAELKRLAQELDVRRRDDPLSLLCELNRRMYEVFDYDVEQTTVESPIDVALNSRRGVCQDFAHIMIALVRLLGVPCRYVSGYLFHRVEDHDRSEQDATHAWLEALLPGLGWIGFDPTNNLIAADRHIRTAVGRDYADVPPTRGVFKGRAESHLAVGVKVMPTEAPIPAEEVQTKPLGGAVLPPDEPDSEEQQQEQQQ
ncbi:transglutaminase family protein [Candidatus Chloroploca sp. M-50]|uniref:Transglutaminase family protein n=1 Tax=Candidatus Chloroploca mongolica TaxID=2528176 RepID=A0ABS4DG32_9CHLR|nr:transglutaminase family protein [Candidatus Chloroploca mongolica]MBP1468392.1 transglutaminase family protein [Candidatus Chloroploca mongolica]